MVKYRGIFIIICTFIVILINLNFFRNTFHSSITLGKWNQRSCELIYKLISFIYLIFMGSIIFFCNNKQIFTIPVSLVAIIIHIIYMCFLLYIKPYKMSLHIHSIGLMFCHAVYLLFLIFINAINFVYDETSQK